MEKIVRQSLLYDFYGELLTEHQKNIYQDVVMNDLSYSEIAREYGISRQGVYDMMKRSDKILEEYEAKLKLVEKFENAREKIAVINEDGNLVQSGMIGNILIQKCCLVLNGIGAFSVVLYGQSDIEGGFPNADGGINLSLYRVLLFA